MSAPLNHRFSRVIREIEQWLAERDPRPFTDAAYALVGEGKLQAEQARALEWAWDVRNLLSHRVVDGQDPVEVRPATIRTLERIRNSLTGNVPTVRGLHGPVVTVTPDTTVAEAALTMADRDYTCLPVEVRDDVVGAVDSDMVMHWLADGLGADGLIEDTTIGDLRAAWPDPPVRFLRADCTQRAAVAAFEDALRGGELTAAILLTPEGTARGPLRGIITPWDVASLDR